jgi:hypothetical protein
LTLVLQLAIILVPGFSTLSHVLVANRAYADGLTQENLPPASVGNRDASLFVKVNPPILTSSNVQDAYMQFRLFDANNNQTIQHVTYHITITKASAGSDQNELLDDFFHAHNGLLMLKIQPSDEPLIIYGNIDPFQNAYIADPGGVISIKGPLLLEGGLYHLQIEIFGIDNDRIIFAPDSAPEFDSYLSVGDVSDEEITYQGQRYNTTIISYYDKISDFTFDQDKKTLSWSMPFSWNSSRIKSVNIFVHEEVRIPKSIKGIGDAVSYDAEVNGHPLSGRMLAVDPYSFEDVMILHYLLNKNDLLSMSQSVPEGSDKMQFTLAASANVKEQTQSDLATDTGGIHVAVTWSPSQLKADTESTLHLFFSDAFSGGSLGADVEYSLRILDKQGKEVFGKSDLMAKAGSDIQAITFPNDETYNVEVKINGLLRDGQTADQTRNGVARGVVVVPEFPGYATALFAFALLLGIFIMTKQILRRPGKRIGLGFVNP